MFGNVYIDIAVIAVGLWLISSIVTRIAVLREQQEAYRKAQEFLIILHEAERKRRIDELYGRCPDDDY